MYRYSGHRMGPSEEEMKVMLLRTMLPSDWVNKSTRDEGYCYLNLYAVERRQKMAFIHGRYPTWAAVKAFGGFAEHSVHAYYHRNGSWHIGTGGVGVSPKYLEIPDNAVLGVARDFTGLKHVIALVMMLFRLVLAGPVLTFLIIDEIWKIRVSRQRYVTGGQWFTFALMVSALLPGIFAASRADVTELVTLTIPDHVTHLHPNYLKSLDFGLPNHWMCTNDASVRRNLLSLIKEHETTVDYVIDMCPQLAEAPLIWVRQAMLDDMKLAIDTGATIKEAVANAAGTVVSAVGAELVDAAVYTANVHDATRQRLASATNAIGGVVVNTVDTVVEHIDDNNEVVGDRIESIIKLVKHVWAKLPQSDTVVDQTADAVNSVRKVVKVVADQMPDERAIGNRFVSEITDITKACDEVVKAAKSFVVTGWERAWTADQVYDGGGAAVLDGMAATTDLVRSTIKATTDWVKTSDVERQFVKVVDNGPWFSQRLGETVTNPIREVLKLFRWEDEYLPPQAKRMFSSLNLGNLWPRSALLEFLNFKVTYNPEPHLWITIGFWIVVLSVTLVYWNKNEPLGRQTDTV